MLLWLNGMTSVQKTPIERMMDDYSKIGIVPLLVEDEFYLQSKNLEPKTMEFINKNAATITSQLLDIIVQIIPEIDDTNYDAVAVYPLLAVEFFELDIQSLTDQLAVQQQLLKLFSLLDRQMVPEPQWSNLSRIVQLLLTKQPNKLSQFLFETKVQKFCLFQEFLNYQSSPTVNNMVIQLFNSESHPGVDYSQQKLEFLQLAFKGFHLHDQMGILNFTALIHDVMTKLFAQDQAQKYINFLISKETIGQMFSELEKSHEDIFLSKSATHILSLISNYYSYSMQNISIDEPDNSSYESEYHLQLTEQFEKSEFYLEFMKNLHIFQNSIEQLFQPQISQPIRTLRLKIIEIFDNLVRVSNIKLWTKMTELRLLNTIISIFFKFTNSNILQSLVDKLVMYIFNRAISDFHPFWTIQLVQSIGIYDLCAQYMETIDKNFEGPLFQLANRLLWFQKEINEKILIDGSSAKFIKTLQSIRDTINGSQKWRNAQLILQEYNKLLQIQLGTLESKTESIIPIEVRETSDTTAMGLINKLKQNTQQTLQSVAGDDPAIEFESPERTEQANQPQYEYQQRQSPTKPESTQKPESPCKYEFAQQVYLKESPLKESPLRESPLKEPTVLKSKSLQQFVQPVNQDKLKNLYRISTPPQTKDDTLINTSPEVLEIIKKYSNLSSSLRLGQASEPVDIDNLKSDFKLQRRKSMESSTKLKQLQSSDPVEEFKVKGKQITNETRVLVVDEIDVGKKEEALVINQIAQVPVPELESAPLQNPAEIQESKQNIQPNPVTNPVPEEFSSEIIQRPPQLTQTENASSQILESLNSSFMSNQSFSSMSSSKRLKITFKTRSLKSSANENPMRDSFSKDYGQGQRIPDINQKQVIYMDDQYDLFNEELSECLPEQLKEFVQHYSEKFVALAKENDPLYRQFISLSDRFQEAASTIDVWIYQCQSIQNDVTNIQNVRLRCVQLLNTTKQVVVEDLQAEDQLAEMIDNLSTATFEKDYNQAVEFYELLKDSLKSVKFSKILKKQEIKELLNQTYDNLTQSIIQDYTQCNPAFQPKDLVKYLMILEQPELLVKGFLSIQQRNIENWILQIKAYDDKTIDQYHNLIEQISSQFEQTFATYLKSNRLLYSFLSQWKSEINGAFYERVSRNALLNLVTIEELFYGVEQVVKCCRGTLSVDIQSELALSIEEKISELFTIYGAKINQLIMLDEGKIASIYLLNNLQKYDELFLELKEIKCKQFQQLDKSGDKLPGEVQVKSTSTVKSIFDTYSGPVAISSIYLWNFVFKLADHVLNFLNPKLYGFLSVQLIESSSKLILAFLQDFQKAVSLKSEQSLQEGLIPQLYQVAQYYGNFTMTNYLGQYVQNRAGLLQFPPSNEWKLQAQPWHDKLRGSLINIFKLIILDKLPFWFIEFGRVYTQKSFQRSPSMLFLVIGFVVCEIRNYLQFILHRQPLIFYLQLLWDLIKYILEYVLYWNYHSLGKNNEVFFLDTKTRTELALDYYQINLYLQTNVIKLSHLSPEGIQQFALDIQFIGDLHIRLGCPLAKDQFLNKFQTLCQKERKCDIPIQTNDFQDYFKVQYEKDMLQAKQFIESQRKNIYNL